MGDGANEVHYAPKSMSTDKGQPGSRKALESAALDIVAGRGKPPAAAKPKAGLSGFAMASILLWLAAAIVIGGAVVLFVLGD